MAGCLISADPGISLGKQPFAQPAASVKEGSESAFAAGCMNGRCQTNNAAQNARVRKGRYRAGADTLEF